MRIPWIRAVAAGAALFLVTTAAVGPPPAASGERHLVVAHGGWSDELDADVAQAGGRVVWSSAELGIALTTDLDSSGAAMIRSLPGVSAVEDDRSYSLHATDLAGHPDAEEPIALAGSAPDAAAFYPWQWNLQAIDAKAAWDAGRFGSPEVTVAILDSGIDYLHPDLNGLVDLSRSLSLVPQDDVVLAAMFPGRHPVTDMNGHGSVVSSIVASNAQLVAGVTRDTTLIGVKVCDYTGDCLEGATLAGIVHAVDAGADVINFSIGAYGGAIERREIPGLMSAINRVVNYAHRNDVILINAAGNSSRNMNNDGNDFVGYCDSPHVVCVTATGATSGGFGGPWPDPDSFANYSNFGAQVTFAGPGGQVVSVPTDEFSVIWGPCPSTLVSPSFLQQAFCGLGVYPGVGTSFAAPAVSGLAALLVEDVGRNPQAIVKAIRKAAIDRGKPGRDQQYGFGRIDVPGSLGIE